MSTTDVSTTVLRPGVDYLPPPDPKAVEQAMLIGDISQMTDAQRIAYYVATCKSLNLNPLTKPFQALKGDDGKMTLYPDKGCAEQLRKLHRVSIKVIGREFLDDLYIVTVRATTPDGREEESQGVVPIAKPKGTWKEYEYKGQQRRRFEPELDSHGHEVLVPLTGAERASALMRGETKAKRRATLAICGLGLPEWDQEPTSPAHPMALGLQAAPVVEAGKDKAIHIADLCGDPLTPPAGEAGAVYHTRIEALVLAQPGWNVEAWDNWAVRRFHKPVEAFTEAQWQEYVDRVERAIHDRPWWQERLAQAERELADPPDKPSPDAPDATPAAPPAAAHVPGTEGAAGTQGPSWGPHGPQGPDLFAQEEREAEEYGG
jgi:hypothetical protein